MLSGGGWSLALFYVLVLFVLLAFLQELFHRYAKFALVLFSIASIIFFPCWVLLIGVEDWFLYVKSLSIMAGIILLTLFRVTNWKIQKLVPWFVYIFLVVNILEAVVKDAGTGHIPNVLNAIAGLLLIATLNGIDTIRIKTEEKYKDLVWGSMTAAWIIGYTLWNWVFVYLNFVQGSANHLAVLASALIIIFVSKERWLQARVVTLGTYFLAIHLLPRLNANPLISVYDEQFGFIVALIAFGFMLAYTMFYVRNTLLERKEKGVSFWK